MKTRLVNFGLVCLSSYFALLLVNIFILDIYSRFVFDMRTRYEVVFDKNEKGEEAYPMAPPSSLIETSDPGFKDGTLIPLSGVSNVNTIYCNENGFTSSYIADRFGFNNPDSTWEKDKVNLTLVGDSFAQGACVKPQDDIAGNLRQKNLDVLNLGVGGHDPLLELATLVEYGQTIPSRAIIWLYCESNDLYFLQPSMEYLHLANYLFEGYSQNLPSRQPEIDAGWKTRIAAAARKLEPSSEPWYVELKNSLLLSNFKTLYNYMEQSKLATQSRHETWLKNMEQSRLVEDLMTHLYYDSRASLPLFAKVMERAKVLADEQGSDFYFVYLPSYERYFYSLDSLQSEVLDIVAEQNIQVINFAEHMDTMDDPLSLFPFRKRGHFSPEGYQVLADYISKQLSLPDVQN